MTTFHIPLQNQGQIVEVSYAMVEEGIVMRVYDRSDKSEYFRLATWTARLEKWADSVGPQNDEPPTKQWSGKLSAARVARLLDDDG